MRIYCAFDGGEPNQVDYAVYDGAEKIDAGHMRKLAEGEERIIKEDVILKDALASQEERLKKQLSSLAEELREQQKLLAKLMPDDKLEELIQDERRVVERIQ